MFIADFTQSLQVTLRRQNDTASAGNGFNNDGSNCLGTMKGNQLCEFLCQLCALSRQTSTEAVPLNIQGMTHVVYHEPLTEILEVMRNPGD